MMDSTIENLNEEIERTKWELQEFRAAMEERHSFHVLEKNKAENHLKLQREQFERIFSTNFCCLRLIDHEKNKMIKQQQRKQMQQKQQKQTQARWSGRGEPRTSSPPIISDVEVQHIHVVCMKKAKKNSEDTVQTTNIESSVFSLETMVLCGIHQFVMAEGQLAYMEDELKKMTAWSTQILKQWKEMNQVAQTKSSNEIISMCASMCHDIHNLSHQWLEKLELQHTEMKQIHENAKQEERNMWRQHSLDLPSKLQRDDRLDILVARLQQKCAAYKDDNAKDQLLTSKSEKPYRRRNSLWDSIVNTTTNKCSEVKKNKKEISRRASLGDVRSCNTRDNKKKEQPSRRGSFGSGFLSGAFLPSSLDYQFKYKQQQQQQHLNEKTQELSPYNENNDNLSKRSHRRGSLGWMWKQNEESKQEQALSQFPHIDRREDHNEELDDKIGDYEALLAQASKQDHTTKGHETTQHPPVNHPKQNHYRHNRRGSPLGWIWPEKRDQQERQTDQDCYKNSTCTTGTDEHNEEDCHKIGNYDALLAAE